MFPAFSQVFTAENMLYLFRGALLSLLIAAISLLIGLLLGILGASGKRSKHAVPKAIANFYVEVIRGTPLLLQILIIFRSSHQFIPLLQEMFCESMCI